MAVKRSQQRCPDRYTLAQNWHSRPEQYMSHDEAVHSRYHKCIVSFFPLALFSREQHEVSSTPSNTSTIAAFITGELSTKLRASDFPAEFSKFDIVPTPFRSPFLVKTFKQAISFVASTRERSARGTLFQALSNRHLFSCSIHVTLQDFDNKRPELQAAK